MRNALLAILAACLVHVAGVDNTKRAIAAVSHLTRQAGAALHSALESARDAGAPKAREDH